ncbi:MAG: four-carbon acid sugar kinase family protein [Deltaproteobacteria bacterium]|jgi:uncharacterized protein YgbK (DUF1537 family)|nr:four-carbon acid sugar kinase family protein [Deltaproteobacteria bacterium]
MDIAVIADDLTGANADGALLTTRGFCSATCLDLESWREAGFSAYSAITYSADSRLLTAEAARDKVYKASMVFAAQKPVLMAKRIDSTLRGNLGAEIDAALQGMDVTAGQPAEPAVAVVVPAYPSSGRVVVGGYLVVHGTPLEQSPIAKDPATPVFSSFVQTILAGQTGRRSGLIALSAVLAGPEAVLAEASLLVREGCSILVCDAVSDTDIRNIAEAFGSASFPVLAVDPGPFTAELAAVRLPSGTMKARKRVLAVIGSPSELTFRQMEALRLAYPAHIVRADWRRFLSDATRQDEIELVLDKVRAGAEDAAVLGVCSAEKPGDVFSLAELSATLGLPAGEISGGINNALAVMAERLLDCAELRIGGLYSSGGEVTVAVIRRLGGKGFGVRGEVLPLAACGNILQGRLPDLPMVTKGGFVGDDGALVQCVDYLFAEMSAFSFASEIE